ncbi:Protein ROOT PRIMORDIUM DEFECTIVE like [Actinidia chinensis var. chinensis]|uniref:Protein ROOT PRIMORDIUM DEFECTIVE like n=1 Tax=Actinidia chinensis var. chinensis TaxID=1590841 RepID=A0A2R6RGJ2_ACTCC|nr:Protein ROOT PRIMORDIUM DEFECTIVE like [Actinidia chinensis var. chinensis]
MYFHHYPMAVLAQFATNLRLLRHRLTTVRTFVDAKIKWVRDPYLDTAVEKEKHLKPMLSLKTLILSQPSKTLPLSAASAHAHRVRLPTAAAKFVKNYPSVFVRFRLRHRLSLPHIKLASRALIAHKEEALVLDSPIHRKNAAERLARLLMLAGARRLPLKIIDGLEFDLGLPHNYVLTLVSEFPEYFQICSMHCDDSNSCEMLGLELISWRDDLAISVMERRVMNVGLGGKRGMRISFPMELPRGFDLEKKVRNWVDEWQKLPYISPYENAFHLPPNGDQAEKWAVAVLHELLHLLVSKKTEIENVYRLGDYLGFGKRFKKALVHHPGIFYVSNKLKTQTVVLREAYRKDLLVEKHPLMGMRYRYIHLMNKTVRQSRAIRTGDHGRRKQIV